jgi:predicted  nucleic acid-binding Zn-ribbon protein
MGPTNVALVKLFRADQALRDAKGRLDAATKNVRLQERRCADLAEKHRLAHAKHRELLVRAANLDLDIKTREAQIERLRTQQQAAKNNKEYQTFLIEINTRKVDQAKVDEEAMKVLEQTETVATEMAALATALEGERAKLETLKAEMGDTVARLQAEIDSLQIPRDQLSTALVPKARTAFDKLADHHDGEALAALIKPDRRREEYACSGCMMDLVTDVYNKLHSRDELVFCPSCRRILFIPDDLPVEMAVNAKKPAMRPASSAAKAKSAAAGTAVAEPVQYSPPPPPKTQLETLLTDSQGESVKNAVDADQRPGEFQVTVDGRDMGLFKGKSADNLLRIIRFRLGELKLQHEVVVTPTAAVEPATTVEPSSTGGTDIAAEPAQPVESA